jgi:hypothetical protein
VLSKSIALSAVYITLLLISKLIIDGGRYLRVNKQKLILRVVVTGDSGSEVLDHVCAAEPGFRLAAACVQGARRRLLPAQSND